MLYQHKILSCHVQGKSVDTSYDKDAIIQSFADMKAMLGYSGIPVPIRSHEFGAADVLPKNSDLENKSRPLGSYRRHAGRKALSVSCKCANFGLAAIMKNHPCGIAVGSVRSVRDKCFDDVKIGRAHV